MGGFAEILSGIGEAAHADRLEKQKIENERSRGIASLLLKSSEDETLAPEQVNQLRQTAIQLMMGKVKSDKAAQLLTDRALHEARRREQAPFNNIQIQPEAFQSPELGVAMQTAQQTANPYAPGSVAYQKHQAQIALNRNQAMQRLQEITAENEGRLAAIREQARLRPPPAAARPIPVGGRFLVDPISREVVFDAGDKQLDQNLSFERHEDQMTGDVTVIGRDPRSGAEKFRTVEKGVSRNRAPQGPQGSTVLIPEEGGYRAMAVKPGTFVPQGAVTQSGMSSLNVPTSTTRTMKEAAPKVKDLAARTRELVRSQQKTLGPAMSRWNEFMAGKVGAPNPEFAKLRTDALLLKTLLMRMHVGARGGVAFIDHFTKLMDTAIQSPENLLASLDEIEAYADTVIGSKVGEGGELRKPPGGEQNVEKWVRDKNGKLVRQK